MALVLTLIGKDKLSPVTGKAIGVVDKLGSSIFRLGKRFVKFGALAGAAIAGVSIKMAADMEKGLREIGTLMDGLTDNQMRAMGHELEIISARTGQAMGALTKARYDIVSAGFSDAAESAELLRVAADMAVGGVTDMTTAGDLLTTALNAYNLSAEDAVETSNVLFRIVKAGKTTIGELGGSMGKVLAVSGAFGINLKEVGAGLATLTASGQSTEEAVTAIRASIVELLKPQEALADLISETEYKTIDAVIAAKGYAEGLEYIKEQADKSDKPMKDLIGNIRSMQAVLPLTGVQAEKFQQNLRDMSDETVTVAKAAEEMRKSFSMQMSMLKQNVGNILRAIGRSLIEIIQPRIEEANEIMQRLGDIGWDIVGSTILTNWRMVLRAVGDVTLIVAKDIGTLLAKGLYKGFIIAAKAPFKAIGAAITFAFVDAPKAALLGLRPTTDEARTSFEEISDVIGNLINELIRLSEEGRPALEQVEEVASDLQTVLDDVSESMDDVGETGGKALVDMTSYAENFSGSLARAVVTGGDLGDVLKGTLVHLGAMVLQAVLFKAIMESVPGMRTIGFVEKGISAIGRLFEHGGEISSMQHGGVVPIIAHAGEYISTQKATQMFEPELARMNQMAETGRGEIGAGITINIQAIDGISIERILRRNPEEFAAGIKDLVRRRYLRGSDLS